MNPDQPPVPQSTPTPEPNQVPPVIPPVAVPSPESFVVAPQPQATEQPIVVAQPVLQPPVAPVSPFGGPMEPVSSAVPISSPLSASVPQPAMQAVASMPMPQPPKKSKKKLFILLGAVVAGLTIVGVGAWFLIMYIMDHNIALKTYNGSSYSILVPTDYTADTSDAANVTFKNPKSTDSKTLSEENISVDNIPSDQRTAYITAIDKAFTKDSLSSSISSGDTLDNFSIAKTTQSGQEARRIHADIKKSGDKVGTVDFEIVFGTDKSYLVGVSAYITEPAFSNAGSKILDSFTIK
jgi:hypothetical protein